mgnify:CR=1 FL=1
MFFSNKRATAEDRVQRAGQALLIGNYVKHQEIISFGLNDEANALIYFQALAFCMFGAYMPYHITYGKHSWSNPWFYLDNVNAGFMKYESSKGMPPGAIITKTKDFFIQIGKYQGTNHTMPFNEMARMVTDEDSDTDEDAVIECYETSMNRYLKDVAPVLS